MCAVGFIRRRYPSGVFSVSDSGAVDYSLGLVCYSTTACTYLNLWFKWTDVRKPIKHHMMGKPQTCACSLFDIDSSDAQRVKILGNKKHLPSTLLDAQSEGQAFLGTQINRGGASSEINLPVLKA